jgi:hypothetical protein
MEVIEAVVQWNKVEEGHEVHGHIGIRYGGN